MRAETQKRLTRGLALVYGILGAFLMTAPSYGLLRLMSMKVTAGKRETVPTEWFTNAVDLNIRFVHVVLVIGFVMLIFAFCVWNVLKEPKNRDRLANKPSEATS